MPGEGEPDTLVLLPNNTNLLTAYLKGCFWALVLWAITDFLSAGRSVPQRADQDQMTILVDWGGNGPAVRPEPGCMEPGQGTMLNVVCARTAETGLGWWFALEIGWLRNSSINFLFRERSDGHG